MGDDLESFNEGRQEGGSLNYKKRGFRFPYKGERYAALVVSSQVGTWVEKLGRIEDEDREKITLNGETVETTTFYIDPTAANEEARDEAYEIFMELWDPFSDLGERRLEDEETQEKIARSYGIR